MNIKKDREIIGDRWRKRERRLSRHPLAISSQIYLKIVNIKFKQKMSPPIND